MPWLRSKATRRNVREPADIEAFMKRSKLPQPVPARSVLETIVNRLGLRAGLSRHRIISLWPRIVGPGVARHTRATEVRGSVICVEVDSSVWMNELAAIKSTLLEKVNALLDEGAAPITDIRFRQVSLIGSPNPPSPEPEPPVLDEAAAGIVRTTVEPVKDDHLRSLLKRILEKDQRLKHRRENQR